jgi:hypothetical protein
VGRDSDTSGLGEEQGDVLDWISIGANRPVRNPVLTDGEWAWVITLFRAKKRCIKE